MERDGQRPWQPDKRDRANGHYELDCLNGKLQSTAQLTAANTNGRL
jgi:hypothetical protein